MENFEKYLEETLEVGYVDEVLHSVIRVTGLPSVRLKEMVVFEDGEKGEVSALKQGFVEVIVFSRLPIQVGSRVARTGRTLSVKVGEKLLGQAVNALGEPLDETKVWDQSGMIWQEVDVRPSGISSREKIKKQYFTGVTLVDLLVPLGYGQRELVLGNRKTGKSQLLWRAILTQTDSKNISIYAIIGKKKSEIRRVVEFLQNKQVTSKTILVASGSHDSSAEIYLTPYTAMTIAEYFCKQGLDVTVILDDMTTHARYYRELSLLGRKFPGRDSYPGDIFHVHSKLLERSGNFKTGSITCLPLAETVSGDITGYIQTNLMSMTDGHIYFDSNLFFEGKRPAIDPFLSVTRVGRQTQTSLQKDINHRLLSMLSDFEKTSRFIKFGTELGENSREILAMGAKIWKFFDQPPEDFVPIELQVVLFGLLLTHNWDGIGMGKILERYKLNPDLKAKFSDLLSSLITVDQLAESINKDIAVYKKIL
jgi:F-type H+-transporting ATPase subunit alpha